MGEFVLDDTVSDLTSLMTSGSPITSSSFGQVYRRTIGASKDTKEVAVKVFRMDPGRAVEKDEKAMRRELKVWLKLSKHPTIVPLLGIAHVGSLFPALISEWMPSGTLYMYLEQGTISASTKVELVMGVAEGLKYLHSENVVHGDLQPANVLIDGSGNPRLTGFDLATVVGDPELQRTTTSVDHSFDVRWRAPELIGVDRDPEMPTFESDIYSFGSVMFFIISGDIPWKEKKHFYQICIELSRRVTPARPENILDDLWNLIQRCWSWNSGDRPGATRIIEYIDQSRNADLQASISGSPPLPMLLPLAKDLTGQIFGTISDYVASGAFGNVYRCEWRQPSGPVKVAVKAFRHRVTSEQELRRFRRETAIWAHLVHDNIATLYGTTEGFGPNTALVSRWFPDGTLLRLITEQGTTLSIESKLNLLHGIACGLYYLHSIPVVHGDIASSNVLVDIKDGEYKACLTDFGLSNVLGGILKDRVAEGSTARPGATRWTAPELLMPHGSPSDIKPTTQNDMYSFGRVMFHVLTLIIPWHDVDEFKVIRKILSGEEISRPKTSATTSDITDARWNQIERCWSSDASVRPSAFMAMHFLKNELEALINNEHHTKSLDMANVEQITASVPFSRQLPIKNITMAKKKSTIRARNIVIFGAMGAGKSSLVNLIADRDIAKTDSYFKRCTLTWTKYEIPRLFNDELQCNIFDTMGIENPELEPYEYHRSIKNASRLLRELDACGGTSLLVYCVQKGRDNGALRSNYQLFREVLYQRRVPIVMVVTGLEDENVMEKWWERNHASLEASEIVVDGHACVTTLKNEAKYKASKEAVHELIRRYAAVIPVSGGWKKKGIVSAFMRRFRQPNPEDKRLQDKLKRDLEGQCGMKTELASKVAKAFTYA